MPVWELFKIQYFGKAETAFNIDSHRKDVKDPKAIPLGKHFNQTGHNFNLHAKFIIIEQLQDIEKTNKILKEQLKTQETFWIKKLKTVTPSGLKLNPRNAVYIVKVQLSYCIWNPKSAMTSSSYLTSDLFKLISD